MFLSLGKNWFLRAVLTNSYHCIEALVKCDLLFLTFYFKTTECKEMLFLFFLFSFFLFFFGYRLAQHCSSPVFVVIFAIFVTIFHGEGL